MSNYLGSKCIMCGQEFKENDDIVVCPDCGTPYHRECFIKNGKCVNEKLHESGESWREETESERSKTGYKKCPYCETVNKPHSIICEHCGAPLVESLNKQMGPSGGENASGGPFGQQSGANGPYGGGFAFDPNDKCCGMDPEEEFESVKLKDVADFVGKNQMYYLPFFKRIKDTGQKISINIVSFFFPQFYFANRKVWLWAIISILLTTLFSVPYFIYLMVNAGMTGGFLEGINIESTSFAVVYNTANLLNFGFQALMLMFSNWIYYRHVIKKLKQKKLAGESRVNENFLESGGTSMASVFISLAVQTFIVGAIILLFTQ